MKILFLSFYFPPDLSAGSFRSYSLVKALISENIKSFSIDVITTLPNRYSSFSKSAPKFEAYPKHKIYRIPIMQNKNGMIGDCFAFLDYLKGVINLISKNEYDLIYATSSRLMTATLGAYIARKLKKPLYLDIRDIFVDTIRDVLPLKIGIILTPLFFALERYTITYAGKVNLVSSGFLPYFKKRYPVKNFDVFTNGIDNQFLKEKNKRLMQNKSSKLTVLYAGNIGMGQGLDNIIPKLAKRYHGKFLFKIVGDGGRLRELRLAVESLRCKNVIFLPPVNRNELIELYRSADILFLHLNDLSAFKKVLPSKLFEYAATGKPIWAGVAGYAAKFILTKIENAVVFQPCNIDDAISSLENLKMTIHQRTKFKREFSRNKIMKNMAKNLIHLVKNA